MPRSLSSLSRRVGVSLVVAGAIAFVASCGSRTGLFGPDPNVFLPDGAPIDGPADGPTDGPIACVPGTFAFEVATAQLMFVIDRSGSMAFSLNGASNVPPGQLSRWDTLHDALFQTIVPFDTQLAMGAKFYPEVLSPGDLGDPELACRTETGAGIAPALGNSSAILNVFDTTEPRGGTPTAQAIRLAAEYLVGRRQTARTMVIATDGAPNCNGDLDGDTCTCTTPRNDCSLGTDGRYSCLDDANTIAAIKDIFDNRKIPVYVIGIGSTERPQFLQVLDQMAVAGGRPRATTPRHYNVQTAAEMKTALGVIRDSVARCTYLTPSAPIDPNAIDVVINGKKISRDPTHKDGWDWVDQAYGTLAFFGSACDAAQGGAGGITGVVTCSDD